MKLRVLGSAGAELPGFHPPAFVIDDTILLDAGTVGAVLTKEEQFAIEAIFVSHSHLDHIRGIPFLADNMVIDRVRHHVTVYGSRETVSALRQNLMNDVIWPDFSRIPTPEAAVIRYREVSTERKMEFSGYAITPFDVNHSVPALGYVVRKGDAAVLYTGDTGPTETVRKHAAGLSAMIIEVSFPDELQAMALMTGHLTPRLLARELDSIAVLPPRILITHLKPQYHDTIREQLALLNIPGIEILIEGRTYTF